MHALAMREYSESGWLDRLWWFDTLAMLADGMTKGSIDREPLVAVCEQSVSQIVGQAPIFRRLRDAYRVAVQRVMLSVSSPRGLAGPGM